MANPFDLVAKLKQVRDAQGAVGSADAYAPQQQYEGTSPSALQQKFADQRAGFNQYGSYQGKGNLSAQDVASLIYDTGIRDPERVALLTAIARRESGFNSGAHNNNPATNDNSWGLWQINTLPGANPKYASWDLTDPRQNARAMYELSQGGKNLRPWAMYDDGRARYSGYDVSKYLSEARQAAQAVARARGYY